MFSEREAHAHNKPHPSAQLVVLMGLSSPRRTARAAYHDMCACLAETDLRTCTVGNTHTQYMYNSTISMHSRVDRHTDTDTHKKINKLQSNYKTSRPCCTCPAAKKIQGIACGVSLNDYNSMSSPVPSLDSSIWWRNTNNYVTEGNKKCTVR